MENQIFGPMVAHGLLTFGLYLLLGWRRMKLVRSGQVNVDAFRENRNEPTQSLIVKNCLANQFELPVLFYVCCLGMFNVEADNWPIVIVAWLFVATRYAHAAVYVTTNNLKYRSPLFALGYALLGIMWVWLATWIYFQASSGIA